MYSINVNGEIKDFRYKKVNHGYTFYIGDTLIGQTFKMRNNSWSAVTWHTPDKYGPVDGFNSRYSASEYMLKVSGFITKD